MPRDWAIPLAHSAAVLSAVSMHDPPLIEVYYLTVDLRPRSQDRWESLPIETGPYER
jgi:hypothetical protein